MRHYIGIDPGLSGGAALLDEESKVIKTINFKKSERDIHDWFVDDLIWDPCQKTKAIIEKVHSMPKQGVKSMFTFGQSYGFLRGLLIANRIAFLAITPRQWMSAQGCLTKGDKKVTYKRAQEMFPEIRVTHAIADALLIADYCRKLDTNHE